MNKALRKIPYALLLFISLCFISHQARASHAVGADLTYKCLGGNQYEVTLTFYRDCAGIPAPNNPVITIKSASCGQTINLTLSPVAGTGQEVTPICSTAVTTCHGGTFTGIQQWVYTGIVTLPMQCSDWNFEYALCCRNLAITTITNPNVTMFYVYATLNNLVAPCDNSPTFANKPVPFVCVGQKFCFNHGATDADGDSLAYELITPLQSANTTVNYLPPYTATQPLNSSPPVSFDSLNGEICMTPQQLQVTVMAVLVKEYRKGVLIGTVERDMQITVMNCNNNLPWLSGINGTNVFNMTVCAGAPFCFNVLSNDIDTGQTLTITPSINIPGATFSSAGSPHPTGTFCWTPADSQISNTPYCFTATVADNACPYSGIQTFTYCITVGGINVNLGPDQQISCSDWATIYATVQSPDSFTYNWSNGATGNYITVGPGTYWCTVTSGSCSATDTVVVTSPYVPVAAFTNSVPYCANTPVTFTDQSTSFSSTIISWTWNFGDGSAISHSQNPTHTFPGPGTYSVQLVVENNLGCPDTVVHTITILPPPVAAFTYTNACQGHAVTFTDQSTGGATSWHWNFGDGQSSTTQNPSHTYSTAGSFTVTLIADGSGGCADTVTNTITIWPSPTANFTAPSVCLGASTAFNNISTGGTSWNWNFGDGNTSTSQNPNHTYGSAGTYNVKLIVTSANGCLDSITKTVTVNALPVANAGSNVAICSGKSTTLTASGGTSYSWNPGGASGSSYTVSPAATTTYTVTVTSASGCTASATVTVPVNALPVASAGVDIDICKGSSGTLTATGGGTYLWSPGGGTSASITVNPTVNTTYTVTVTNASGCTASDQAVVTVHNPPVITLTGASICPGNSTTLNAGIAGLNYQWSTGATTQTISVTTAGTYSIIVTDSYGCTGTASANITASAAPVVSLANASVCQGQTTTFDAGNAGSTYIWLPGGQTTKTITTGTAGTYTVTVTNANGCSATASATLTVNPLPTANAGPDIDICKGSSGTLTASGGISYSWSPGGSATASITVNPNATTTYTVTVTDANGCVASDNAKVTVNNPPVIILAGASICPGNSTTLNAGLAGLNYQWSTGATTQTINVTTAGTYSIIVTDAFGCTGTAQANITAATAPVVNLTNASVCQGQTTTFDAGNSGSTYIWSPGGQITKTITTGTSGTYTVTVTNPGGCTATASVTLAVNPLPAANAGPDIDICKGSSGMLTASGGINYVWSPGGGATASITVNPTVNATYTVIVTDANGCAATDNAKVFVHNPPAISLASLSVCPGDSTLLDPGVSGLNYLWSTGATTQTINVSTAGTYSLIATDSYGCSNTASTIVTTSIAGVVSLSDGTICQGQTVTFDAGNPGSTYIWSPGGQTTKTIVTGTAGTYSVVVTGANGCHASGSATLTVNPLPVANAGPDIDICNGSSTTLIASGGVSYAWSPGGSSFDSLTVNPTVNTTYTVTVTDVNGCSATDKAKVFVHNPPAISLANVSVCPGDSTTLNPGVSGLNYQWSTGETTQTINITSAGTYSLTATDAFGCSNTASTNVTAGTAAIINLSNATVCQGQTVTFDAGNPGSAYIWSPNGETTQTIVTGIAGTYSVTVTGVNGCHSGAAVTLTVNPLPIASAGTDQNICNGSTATLTASGGSSYQWSPGGSSNQTITVNPNANTTYTVTVTNASGCVASSSANVIVNPLPIISLVPASLCSGSNATLDAGNPGSIYLWSPNGETTQSISVSTAGNYSVTVTNASGCSASATTTVSSASSVIVNSTAIGLCPGQSAIVDAGNPGSSYVWSTGATTQTINVNTAGTYTVTVTTSNGCTATIVNTVNQSPSPVVQFNSPSNCSGNSTQFTDESSISSGSITSWNWTFGDGQTSTQQNPAHIYNSSGTFTVSLTVNSNNGCSANSSQSVTINPLPVANFNATAVCVGDTSSFTDLSNVNGGSIAEWSWTFGDGQSSNAQNPKHIYTVPGNYSATLVVATANGCFDTTSAAVVVNNLPAPAFTAPNVCSGMITNFNNTSTIGNGSISSYSWSFGDGSNSNLQQPSHQYSADGSYMVTLTATSSQGCVQSVQSPVDVLAKPAASYTSQNVCQGSAVNFTDHSTTGNGSISSWNWTFNDGNSSVSGSPNHTYTTSGTYNVTLVVTSSDGCTDSVTNPVVIYPLPSANFNFASGCQNSNNAFNNLSTISSGNITSYSWAFGDGLSSVSVSPQHLYAASGSYNVTLIVSSDHGCIDTITHNVNVFPTPNVDFTGTNVCLKGTTDFSNQSTVNGGNGFTSSWSFGDSATSALANPSHTYTTGGSFNVSLIVTSDSGCSLTITKPVQVYWPPVAAFSAANSCLGAPSVFNDESISKSGSIARWNWNFGDGTVDSVQRVTHNYKVSGQYNVSLIVTSSYGCNNAANNSLAIYPVTAPAISAPGVCEGSPVSFTNSGDTIGSSQSGLLWNFGDGMTSDSLSANHTYTTYGTYYVTLQTTNQYGCSDTVVSPVHIYPKPDVSFNVLNACFGLPVNFGNTSDIPSGQITSYYWNFGDSLGYSTQANPTYRYPMDGTYTVSLNEVSDHGCTAEMQEQVTMYPVPVVIFSGVAKGCSPVNAAFLDGSTIDTGNIVGWLWDFGDGNVSTQADPTHTYDTPGNYLVNLTVSSDKGCVASGQATENVVVLPAAKAEFTMNPTKIDPMNPVVQFTNLSSDYDTYSWTFGDGTGSSEFSPSHIYQNPGDYTIVLVVNNTYNCPDTAMRRMDIEPVSTLYAPNAFTPNDDGTNDVWQPKFTEMTDIRVWIFDRWGEMINKWDGLNGSWDGTYKGKPAQIGVYVYQIEGTGIDGKLYRWTGDITLVR